MSFVPLQGVATFVAGERGRESEVEFTGAGNGPQARVIRMPIRGAIPVLTRAMRADSAHPSVSLLSAATLLALRLIARGRVQEDPDGETWRIGPLDPDHERQVGDLATAWSWPDSDAEARARLVRQLLDAVADAMSRPTGSGTRPPARGRPIEDTADPSEYVDRVRLSLRIEAPDEVLAGGRIFTVLQIHDADDASRVADADAVWSGEAGFGPHARSLAAVALREAAASWPGLDALLRRPVPDRVELDTVEIAALLETGLPALTAIGVDVYWPRSLRPQLEPQGRVEIATREGPLMTGLFGPDALFEFDWRVALDGDPLTDSEMAELASATTPIIKLRDNWAVIDPALARQARRRLGARELKPAAALQATLTGALEVDGEVITVHPGARIEKVRDRIIDASTLAPMAQPDGLDAELRDYQRRGLTWLAELTGVGLGACLADDMGLGKTITLIALHLHRRHRRLALGPTLVVCPASLLGNWQAEIERFAPGVAVRRFHGAGRDLADLQDGFVLTTYGTMRRDHAILGTVPWDLVVADEAQHIKNATASTARNLRTIGSRCRVALTGTPVENNLTELWAILDWATPGLLGSRAAFRKVWAAPIESGVDPAVARRFAQLVEPFLLRRRKSDPGIAPELPPKTETDQIVGLTQEQVVLYEALVRRSMERIEQADEDTRRGLVLALLTGLKQICNHPAHYLRESTGRLPGRSEKLDLLSELVTTVAAEGGATLVFTQYVAMARLIERELTALDLPTLFLHGGTPVPAREEMVGRFQAGDAAVFLLSLKAGGTGLNLTRADHVVHFDRWWNPAVEDQATDRAYRIGQDRPVQVHRLMTEGTIEEKVGRLLERKRSLAESVLGRGQAALTELSDGELRDLVTLRTPYG